MNRSLSIAIVAVLLALSLTGCGDTRDVLPNANLNPTGPKDAGVTTACKANLRAIYSSEQAFQTENGRYPTAAELAQLPGGMPNEPTGGTYTIDPANGTVTCSVGHGKFPE